EPQRSRAHIGALHRSRTVVLRATPDQLAARRRWRPAGVLSRAAQPRAALFVGWRGRRSARDEYGWSGTQPKRRPACGDIASNSRDAADSRGPGSQARAAVERPLQLQRKRERQSNRCAAVAAGAAQPRKLPESLRRRVRPVSVCERAVFHFTGVETRRTGSVASRWAATRSAPLGRARGSLGRGES